VENLQQKIIKIKKLFQGLSPDEKIQRVMSLSLPPYPSQMKIEECRIRGCQSTLYLSSRLENNRMYFDAEADALISAGLAALLINVYSSETPETILKNPPNFLKEIGLIASLSPGRANGLAYIHQRMKKDALKFLLSTIKTVEPNLAPR
jgi:cysteine desulfuration protein SufE